MPRRALLHGHELWDCFGGGGHAVSEPENPVIMENPVLMELGADEEPGADGALQELCVRPLTASPVCVRGGGIAEGVRWVGAWVMQESFG